MIPQPGQGNPVSILNGQKDCLLSSDLPTLLTIIIYGTTSVIIAPAIPYILRFRIILFV